MTTYINGVVADEEDLKKLWEDIKSGIYEIKANCENDAVYFVTNN